MAWSLSGLIGQEDRSESSEFLSQGSRSGRPREGLPVVQPLEGSADLRAVCLLCQARSRTEAGQQKSPGESGTQSTEVDMV